MEFSGLYDLTYTSFNYYNFSSFKSYNSRRTKKIIAMILNSYIIPSVENKKTYVADRGPIV